MGDIVLVSCGVLYCGLCFWAGVFVGIRMKGTKDGDEDQEN